MTKPEFIHNEDDKCHDNTLTLHDCIADKVDCCDGFLRFHFPQGFWIYSGHAENNTGKTVKTDAAVVDFFIEDLDEIKAHVLTPKLFGTKKEELWEVKDVIDLINGGNCSIEFIYQYRTFFEQMWECAIRSEKKPHYRRCQLHLPKSKAVFRWNNLRNDCVW